MRFLHFGTEWVQGADAHPQAGLDRAGIRTANDGVDAVHRAAQQHRAVGPGYCRLDQSIVIARIFRSRGLPLSRLNPSVDAAICNSMFKLPPEDERLTVLEMDALDFVNDRVNFGAIDVLQVDLYDATARGPVLDTPEFYQSCAACLTPRGVLTVNLFGDHSSFAKNLKALKFAFDEVFCLPEVHDGNVVAIAFKNGSNLDIAGLYERAAAITEATKLPAKSWVNGLKAAWKTDLMV